MSQSDEHKDLVIQMVAELEFRHPQISITADIQKNSGDPVPPMISNFRPDVYARLSTDPSVVIIAEAKTDRDIENSHTRNQIMAFINYCERRKGGFFILSVTGCGAGRAKTLLRFLYQDVRSINTVLAVFDGCDLWSLDSTTGVKWHLI